MLKLANAFRIVCRSAVLPCSVWHSLILKLPFSLDPFLCCLYFTFREVSRFWTSFRRKLGWGVASRIMGHWKLCSIEETQTVVDTEVFLWRIPVVEFSLLARKVKLSLGWKCWERFEWKILGLIICGLDPRWPLRQRPSCLEMFYVFLHVLWLLRLAVAS